MNVDEAIKKIESVMYALKRDIKTAIDLEDWSKVEDINMELKTKQAAIDVLKTYEESFKDFVAVSKQMEQLKEGLEQFIIIDEQMPMPPVEEAIPKIEKMLDVDIGICGRRTYKTENEAINQLKEIAVLRETYNMAHRQECAYYYCGQCEGYHLTSNRQREKGKCGKVVYTTNREAADQAPRISKKFKMDHYPYYCEACDGYHLTVNKHKIGKCGKLTFLSMNSVKTVIDGIKNDGEEEIYSYYCGQCDGYHLTGSLYKMKSAQ